MRLSSLKFRAWLYDGRAWAEHHTKALQRTALITVDALGALALITLAPSEAWTVVSEFKSEVTTQGMTYGWMVVACILYAFALAAIRQWQSALYERLLYWVVIGGVIIVGASTWWRVSGFPIPDGEAREVAQWTLRIVAYHFTTAALPMVLWQFGQEQSELREARKRRAQRARAK